MTMAIFKITADEFRRKFYPAFSRRATQVCILSAALEKIAMGWTDSQVIAQTALAQANPFGWNEREGAKADQPNAAAKEKGNG